MAARDGRGMTGNAACVMPAKSEHPERSRRRRLWTPLSAGVAKPGSGGLGELHLLNNEGVVEPASQRLEVGRLDRRAAPDAQAWRGVAIGADVEGDLLLLEQTRQRLRERRLSVGRQSGDRRIDDLETDAGVGARLGRAGEEIDP